MLKKLAIGATLVILSAASYADQVTVNKTNDPSTVRITSGHFAGVCSSDLPSKLKVITPPQGTSTTTTFQINLICHGSGSACTANLFMTNDCSGPVVATASMDLGNHNVTVNSLSPNYHIEARGNTVYLCPISGCPA